MTLSELKKKIAESNIKDWYQSRTLVLDYSYINYNISLKGIAAIYDFILKQLKGFSQYDVLPDEIAQSKKLFEDFKLSIIQIANEESENNYLWNSLVASMTNISRHILPSDASETIFLIELHKTDTKH
jgi:hypothetical protein